jgi:5-methyltetrahydrofolate--homocysteine methyltransferase
MSSIHEAIKKTYSSLMEWEPCCNGTISLKKILEENVSKIFHILQRKQRFAITQPQAIKEVHAAYFEAGADIVETNTSQEPRSEWPITTREYVYELNYESAKIAREVADEFTAKKIQTTTFCGWFNRSNKQNGKYVTRCKRSRIQSRNFDDLRIAYKQQVEALIDGGSDFLLVETIFDNAKAALLLSKVKTNAILIFPSWFQERLPMLQEEHFLGKR